MQDNKQLGATRYENCMSFALAGTLSEKKISEIALLALAGTLSKMV